MNIVFRAPVGASLGVLALSLAVPAYSEEAAEPDTNRIVVTGYPVVDAAAQTVLKTPGGVSVVGAQEFEDKLAVSLRDALAFAPGVYTQPRFGQEIRLSVRGSGISRGFHMRGVMLLQDGIPTNLADNNGDFQELDPQVFQHIEVYRGSNALRYGASTLGGGINAVTPTGRTAPGYEARIDGGSFDTWRAKVAGGFSNTRGDAYIALTTDNGDGDRQHAKRNALRFTGNVGLKLTDTLETRFYAMVSHINQDLPGSLNRFDALNNPRKSNPGNIANDQERDIDSIRLQNRTTLALENGTLEGGVFLNAKQLFHPIFQVIDQQSTDYGAYARLTLAGDIGGVPVEATIGTTARFGHVVAKQFVNVLGNRGTPTQVARQEARTIDSYGEIRVQPVDGFSLIAGGVYTSGRRTIDNRTNATLSGTASFNTFAPKLGILYEPDQDVQIFANYSRSIELPGYSELAQTQVGGLTGFVNLDPQRGWTAEIGTRGRKGPVAWDITAYRATIRGEMLQFVANATIVPAIPAATFNADRTLHQGIEAGLTVEAASFARLRGTWTYSDFRFRNDRIYGDNRLPVIPRHAVRGEVRLGTEAFHVTPSIEWVPQGAFADYTNTTRAPGYTLFSANASADVTDGITLFLDVRNITGKKAIGDISAVVTATPASIIYYPVERRAIYGGVRARF